jgi:hypothetical protein
MAQVTTYAGRNFRQDAGAQRFTSTDSAADDSDKTITVPTGEVWRVENVFVTNVTSADAGNRQMTVLVADPAAVTLLIAKAVAVQTASGTEYYNFSPTYGTATETPATFHFIPLPTCTLDAGATIRVYDSAAIAAAADDMTVTVTGLKL